MQQDSGYGPLPWGRGSGSWLTHPIVGVLAAGLAVAGVLLFFTPASGRCAARKPARCLRAGSLGCPAGRAAEQNIVNKVKPGLVLINTTLRYDSREAAAGTGMVVNADGLVLTNNHVVEDFTKITATVTSTGGAQQGEGHRILDQTGDVALIQLQNASGLTTVPMGESTLVEAGNAVVAMGNAEGQGHITATAWPCHGGEYDHHRERRSRLDQHRDTARNDPDERQIVPGDSGGPLASPGRRHRHGHRGQRLGRPAGTCRRVRDPDRHGAVGRPADRRRSRRAGSSRSALHLLGVFVGSGSSS